MTERRSSRLGEQNESYRKGLVLGLTMAEVAILIIFVLLLLLAFGERRRQEVSNLLEGREPIEIAEAERLRLADARLQEISQATGIPYDSFPEHFTRLVRILASAARSPEGSSHLAEADSIMREIREARQVIQSVVSRGRDGSPERVDSILVQLSDRVANQEGQIARLQSELERLGGGKGERPCWVQADGTIDYLYEVVLTSAGIRMRELPHPHRAAERTRLPAPRANPSEVLPAAEFRERTRQLFDYSRTINCRYFVVVYDATGPSEKERYKSLLATVEGHFYKRLDDGAAPF